MNNNRQLSCFLRVGLVVLIFLSLIQTARAQTLPPKAEISLKAAMAMAISNNLDLRVDALDSAMEKSDLDRSRWIYDPILRMNVNHGQTFYTGETYGTKDTTTSLNLVQYLPTGGNISANTYTGYSKPVSDFPDEKWTDWYTSVGLTYVQPLLKNYGKETMELNISLAEFSHEESLEQFRESVIDTIYDVIKNYNRLYSLRQVLESRQRGLDSAQELLRKLEQKEQSDQLKVELANTEYAISQRLKRLVEAKRDVSDREAKLRYLIGMREKSEIIPIDPPSREEPVENIEQALALALEREPDLQQLKIDLQLNRLKERVSKRKLLPSLAVTASAGFRGIEDRFSDSVDQIADGKGRWWSAGLQFSMPFGNTAAEGDYRRNKLRTKQLENRVEALEWELRDDLEEDMRALISARVQMQVADKAFAVAEQRYQSYKQSVERKSSSVQDLLDAENDLIYARNNQTEALEDFANAVAKFWKDIGVLLERQDINLNVREPEKLTGGHLSAPGHMLTPEALEVVEAIAQLSPAAKQEPADGKERASGAGNKPVATVVAKEGTGADAPVHPTAKSTQTISSTETAVERALYTLKIGTFASSELKSAQRKIEKAGFKPQVQSGPKESREVIRLYGGEFKLLPQAQKEQKRLIAKGAAAFLIKQKGVYHLYAGSYFGLPSARKEQSRLGKKGIEVELEKNTVKVATSLLTAGRFDSHAGADEGARKLEEFGLSAVVQKVARQG